MYSWFFESFYKWALIFFLICKRIFDDLMSMNCVLKMTIQTVAGMASDSIYEWDWLPVFPLALQWTGSNP